MEDRRHDREMYADLIGYHLGLTDAAERTRVEHTHGAESLQRARSVLTRLLAPLDAAEPPSPPAGLVKSVLDRVKEIGRPLPFRVAPSAHADSTTSSPLFSLRELLSLAAAIAMFVAIFVPGYRTARINSQQAMCANNLRQFGNGVGAYNATYSALPLASTVPDNISWVPTAGPAPGANNSRNVYRLVRRQFVTPSVFNCPGRGEDFPLAGAKPEDLEDFPDPRNISYSTQLITQSWQLRPMQPQTPIEADLTPLVDQQRRLIDNRMISRNSTSHVGRGQNVLRIDGSVIFAITPNVGIDNDDIYRVIGVQQHTGLERPRLRSDAFLVP